jgi:hypothetical protein
MTRLNFTEACLLDASGELGPAARRKLLLYVRENPAALARYREILKQFEILPPADPLELSARDRREIPAQIKRNIHTILRRQLADKRAAKRLKLIRWASAGIGSAAAMVLLMAAVGFPHRAAVVREHEQVATLNATIDRLAGLSDQPLSPYDQAVTDVEASIRQLQTESPALAVVHDRSMDNLLDALATVPVEMDDVSVTDTVLPPGAL